MWGCPVTKRRLPRRHLKSLSAFNPMRRCVFQDSWWFNFDNHFPSSSLYLHLDFHANSLKIQEQPFNLLILHI